MITDALSDMVRAAIQAARQAGDLELIEETIPITLEVPRNKQHGDYSTNVALTLKRLTGLNDSREIAARIRKYLPETNTLVARTELAGPGFLNFYLKPDWLYENLARIEAEDTAYGQTEARRGETILIEFVSANPTGPISVVNGRAAALGDVLANLLSAQGANVSREYYINDALNSTQLDKFAESLFVRYLQQLGHPIRMTAAPGESEVIESGENLDSGDSTLPIIPFPTDGYPGEYVKDIARALVAEVGERYREASEAERQAFFREATLRYMVASQERALEAFGLRFDTWFFESQLYAAGKVEQTIQLLKARGYTYELDGALWLRSSALGDEKDRVLIRSNEKATYIAADIAYHDDKFRRGFTRLINIWGADHHGYVNRLKAGVAALGYDLSRLEIILTQMVALVRNGEAVIGGKRAGNIIELKEDLVDEIGKDAARFYFLLNSYETPATVDVELAKKQSNENPVYYVQYAHARLCNILRRATEQGFPEPATQTAALSQLSHPAELDVLRKLADYPDELTVAAREYAPHRLTRYAMDLAGLLNVFYENCRVLPGKETDTPQSLTQARLALVNGARIVLRNLLTLLGISAPETM